MRDKTKYINPPKWVGVEYFSLHTGYSKEMIRLYSNAGYLEKRKCGSKISINLHKYIEDMDNGNLENINLQNVYKKKTA